MYQLTTNPDLVRRIADGATLSVSAMTFDSQLYREWLAEGNEPDPSPEPLPGVANAPVLSGLTTLDVKSVRAMRSVLLAMHTNQPVPQGDIDALVAQEAEAAALRTQLK